MNEHARSVWMRCALSASVDAEILVSGGAMTREGIETLCRYLDIAKTAMPARVGALPSGDGGNQP